MQAASSHSHDTNKTKKMGGKKKVYIWEKRARDACPLWRPMPTIIYKREWTWLFYFFNSNAFSFHYYYYFFSLLCRMWNGNLERENKTPTALYCGKWISKLVSFYFDNMLVKEKPVLLVDKILRIFSLIIFSSCSEGWFSIIPIVE